MSSQKNLEYKKSSFLHKTNSAFIEQMYIKFVNNDPELPESWKKYFKDVGEEIDLVVKEINGPSWSPNTKINTEYLKNEIVVIINEFFKFQELCHFLSKINHIF